MDNNLYAIRTTSGTISLQSKPKFLCCLWFAISLAFFSSAQQSQYADNVINFSSQFSASCNAATAALGAPDVVGCGDNCNAWASLTPDGQREYLVLGFLTPQPVTTIYIYENYNPDAVDTVYLRNAATQVWTQVFSQTAHVTTCPNVLTITIPTTPYNVDAIRIAVNSPAIPDYNEIDAVEIYTLPAGPLTLGYIVANEQTGTVTTGYTNLNMLFLGLPTVGSTGTLTLNSLTVTSGNTNDADIVGVKLWTGTNISRTTQIGTAQTFSSGSATFSGLTTNLLANDTTYIYITYDIASSIVGLPHVADAKINIGGIIISASGGAANPGTQPPVALNPVGNVTIVSPPPSGQWIWLHGDSTNGSTGNYGTQGVSAPTNEPPALSHAGGWTDALGNFWMYGGSLGGYVWDGSPSSNANDLWKYNPLTNEWTWMNGTQTPDDPGDYGTQGIELETNRPPARSGFATWVDLSGNFWLFGGRERQSGNNANYNDLWKYDVTTNEWTWMKGPQAQNDSGVYGTLGVPDISNNPANRREAASWTDSAGNLWLFSGINVNTAGYGNVNTINDLWRYNIATNTWTWMKGNNSNSNDSPPAYGTMGIEDSSNTPGARSVSCKWVYNGCFYLSGGEDFISQGDYDDVWRFNPLTNNWTFIGGKNPNGAITNYGIKCVTSKNNRIGGRIWNAFAGTDKSGNAWTFGGIKQGSIISYQAGTTEPLLNDLWMFCMTNNQWTWKSGDNVVNPAGSWGTLSMASSANKPSLRAGSVGWTDNNGHLYLFGGDEDTLLEVSASYNDLWMFTIDSTCGTCGLDPPTTAFQSSNTGVCDSACISFTDLSLNVTSWQWHFPGAMSDTSTVQNPQNICYSNPGYYDVTLITGNSYGNDTLTNSNYITVFPIPQVPVISQSGDTLATTSYYNSTYQWYFNGNPIPGATNQFYYTNQNGSYTVSIASNGCSTASDPYNFIAIGIVEMTGENFFSIFPNPTSDEVTISSHFIGKDEVLLDIYNILGEKVLSRSFSGAVYTLSFGEGRGEAALSAGIYYIRLLSESSNKIWVAKLVKE